MSEGKGEDPPDGGKLTGKMKEKDKEILLYQEHLEYDTYRVIVQAKRTNENKPNFVSNQKAGQLIGEKVTERANVTEIRRLHRGKLLVVCSSAKTANEIVSDPEIRSLYNPFIPFAYVRRTAVLRDIDDDFDDATLLENIDARQYRILSVQRLNRRVVNEGEVTFVKTRSVKVTFEGQEMPAYVRLFYCRIECVPFTQRVVQCFNCARFGHTSKFCKNNPLCKICFQPMVDNDHQCVAAQVTCINCKGGHKPLEPCCPELNRQKKIKELQSTRNLDFHEAAQFVPSVRSSPYAVKTQNSFAALELRNEDFPSLGNRTQTEDLIEKYVPPALPYMSNAALRKEKNKRYSKEMNDVSRQNKRRDIEENEVHHQKENNEAKKMKQSVESENKFQGRRSEYKQARIESGRGVHDEQRYRKSKYVNASQHSNESDFNMEYAYSQESTGDHNESHLLPTKVINDFRSFHIYRNDYLDGDIACGGVMLMIHKCAYSQRVPVVSNHQVIAARVKTSRLNFELTVCSIYINPDQDRRLQEDQLAHIVSQLPRPYLLCGDFNAHNPMWGSLRRDHNGKQVEKFLLGNDDTVLLNRNEVTHVNFSYGTLSCIDLTLCSQSIVSEIEWSVHNDLCFSDHYPILIKFANKNMNDGEPSDDQMAGKIWLFKRANWGEYQMNITFHDQMDEIRDANDCLNLINQDILKAAKKTIPQPDTRKYKRYVPWWCDEIQDAIKKRRKALRVYRRNPIQANFIEFKRCRAFARNLIKVKQDESWNKFVSEIDKPLTTSDMWNHLKKVRKGKRTYNPIPALENSNSEVVTDRKIITEILADNYVRNSIDAVFCREFIQYRNSKVHLLTCPTETENEPYNLPFTYRELLATFKGCRSSAAGIDDIPYQMIIHLPQAALRKLLDLFNFIWKEGIFPEIWKTAFIIPILKPEKNALQAVNYRPISLLCCTNKILEKMISKRLKWMIEEKQLVDDYQNGNRRQRSTMDSIILLEHEVVSAFQNNEYVVAVFLDICKFYDRISKISVLEKFIEKNVGGPMYKYVENFLSDPQISVKLQGTKSEHRVLQNGIRQGSSLSGDLSNVATCDIGKYIPGDVMHSMFVDDLIIFMRHKDLDVIQTQIQRTLDNIVVWSKKNGMTFAPEKTSGITFTRKRFNPPTRLEFQNHDVKFQNKVRWLGMHLDNKWKWEAHIAQAKTRSLKAMNIMKILGNKKKGLRRQVLMKIYNAYVRPIIDYGSLFYASASQVWLYKLNVVHNSALRMITGAFRTSPICSILAESGQPSLEVRRNIRCVNFVMNAARNPHTPTFLILFQDNLRIDLRNERYPKNIRLRVEAMEGYQVNIKSIIKKLEIHNDPPWQMPCIKVKMLTSSKKTDLTQQEIQHLYLEFKHENENKNFCYTDGTKSDNHTGGAYLFNGEIKKFKLNPLASIFTAELMAIYLCICDIYDYIKKEFLILKDFVIFSDSKSSLQAMENVFKDSALLNNILTKIRDIDSLTCSVSFVWVPSHSGIKENEIVDLAAKDSINLTCMLDKFSASDYKVYFKYFQKEKWKLEWCQDQAKGKHLREIKKSVNVWKTSNREKRQEEVVLCRIRIGHTLATHGFLLDKKDPPPCHLFNFPRCSVKHWILSCPALTRLRNKHKIETSLNKVLNNDPDNINKCLRYLYESKLFLKF
ncbi:hypothetical protein M8J77_006751 [Diaphorina citri]|nr:hypothetical protein M8J77_006751 [Diaphorina citri]